MKEYNAKQLKIINAAIIEFAKNNYEGSSTNNIIKNAEVSKGLLFHYFKSKKNLYIETITYCYDKILEEIYNELDRVSGDFFNRLIQIGYIKYKVFEKNPYMYNLLIKTYINKPTVLKNELTDIETLVYNEQSKRLETIFEDVDLSLFRDDIDFNKIKEIINFVINGVIEKYTKKLIEVKPNNLTNCKMALKEFMEYADILKRLLYK